MQRFLCLCGQRVSWGVRLHCWVSQWRCCQWRWCWRDWWRSLRKEVKGRRKRRRGARYWLPLREWVSHRRIWLRNSSGGRWGALRCDQFFIFLRCQISEHLCLIFNCFRVMYPSVSCGSTVTQQCINHVRGLVMIGQSRWDWQHCVVVKHQSSSPPEVGRVATQVRV